MIQYVMIRFLASLCLVILLVSYSPIVQASGGFMLSNRAADSLVRYFFGFVFIPLGLSLLCTIPLSWRFPSRGKFWVGLFVTWLTTAAAYVLAPVILFLLAYLGIKVHPYILCIGLPALASTIFAYIGLKMSREEIKK